MLVNSKIDRPTLIAKDLAMSFARSLLSPFFFIMKTNAATKLPKIPMKLTMTMYFMDWIIT